MKLGTSRRRALVAATATTAAALLVAGGATTAVATTSGAHPKLTPFEMTSPDFKDGRSLPAWTQWGGDPRCPGAGAKGVNQAPALNWVNPPQGTQGYAVVINDMDTGLAGGFQHWIVYNIPGTATGLAGHGQNPYTEGTNSFGDTNYDGPCPPATGQLHHYVFTLYALDTPTIPGTALDYNTLITEIGPHTLWSTSIVGTMALP